MKINEVQLPEEVEIIFSEEQEIIEGLFTHTLATLEKLFYDLLYINVPRDIYQEIDSEFIKSNICRILAYFIAQTWISNGINLNDKLFRCVQCNQWAYKISMKKNVCIICFSGVDENKPWSILK
jgi:hypothetical protein